MSHIQDRFNLLKNKNKFLNNNKIRYKVIHCLNLK